jgi:predicted transcriptional regulator
MARRKKINLTKGEEEVMLYLWQLGSGSIGQILELWPKPKPKYTTVATFMKLLEGKRCVAHSPLGKKYSFRPLIKKAHYADIVAERMLNNFFDGSAVNLIVQLAQDNKLSPSDREEIIEILSSTEKQ